MFPVLLQENDLIFVLHAGHLEARHLERDSKLLDLRPQLLDVLSFAHSPAPLLLRFPLPEIDKTGQSYTLFLQHFILRNI